MESVNTKLNRVGASQSPNSKLTVFLSWKLCTGEDDLMCPRQVVYWIAEDESRGGVTTTVYQ